MKQIGFSLIFIEMLVGVGCGIGFATPSSKKSSSSPISRRFSSSKRHHQTTTRKILKKKKTLSLKKSKMEKQIDELIRFFRRIVFQFGRDPKNPWLLAHSILAVGKDLTLANGKKAIDQIVENFLQFQTIGKKEIPYFPSGTQENRIEPHPSMHLKTMLEIGVPLRRVFRVNGRDVSLNDILEGRMQTFPSQPKEEELGDLAWTLSAFYGHLKGSNQWMWVNAKKKQVHFFRLVWRMIRYLDHQTSFLRVFQRNNQKVIPKRRQFIYKESCGGFHLMQAVFRWMGHPMLRKKVRPLKEAQIELLFYRYHGETNLYLKLFKKHQKQTGYLFLVLLQQLKFTGHWLETIANLNKWGLFVPSYKQRKVVFQAVRLLTMSVAILDQLGFYRELPNLKKKSYQYYLDMLGDSSHALHALQLLKETKIYRLHEDERK